MSRGGRLVLHNLLEHRDSPPGLADDVRSGLGTPPRTIPSKYFYDARGSRLFEKITGLPEYYQTRAESRILRRWAAEIVDHLRPSALVEFGSGSASKTRILLDAMRARGLLVGYGPVDVSEDASRRAAGALLAAYPELRVEGVIGDFEHPHDLPFVGSRRLMAFLGSTIGNLDAAQAATFLRGVAAEMTPADGFLIGFDLLKEVDVLESAYNDAAGVTAEFNRNVLRVVNRELGADFDLTAFRHRAFFNEAEKRIEMHLESTRRQSIRIPGAGLTIELDEGETIRTELSHKYTRESARDLLRRGDLVLSRWLTDDEKLFALGVASRSA